MTNDSENVSPKKYKITDPEIIRALLYLIPLFFICLAKYVFIKNAIIQQYFSGLPQFLLVILLFGTAWLIEKKIQSKKNNNK
jgi:hypothetical protein